MNPTLTPTPYDARTTEETLRRTLNIFLKPGNILEVRVLKTRYGTVSGYFNDPKKIISKIHCLDGFAEGIYFTPNPVLPDLLARSENALIKYAKNTTADKDILQRLWLPVDFDPIRPSGISSTEEEHQLALEKAKKCAEWLTSQGWPEPILADSGNGAHAVYGINLPNDGESSDLVKRCLESLNFRFSDERVKVDLTPFNAARIWKFYGTLACKGSATSDRPHRRSGLIDVPNVIKTVPPELLRALTSLLPKEDKKTSRHQASKNSFNLDLWITSHKLPVVTSGSWNGGRKWILNPCPFNSEHTDEAAFIVQLASGAISAGCRHDSCSGKSWQDLRATYEPGWQKGKFDKSAAPSQAEEEEPPFFKGREFLPALLAEEIQKSFSFVSSPIDAGGSGVNLLVFSGGVFSEDGAAVAREAANKLLGHLSKPDRLGSTLELLLENNKKKEADLNPRALDLINVKNGMLDWRTGKLFPHDPKYLSTFRINTPYDPKATSGILDKFLSEIFPSDALPLAEELLGYLLLPTTKYQVCFVLIGSGANGKSTFLSLVRNFIGDSNASSISLQELTENRFCCAELLGKVVNIYPDLPSGRLEESDIFKSIVGGDWIKAERKYGQPFQFKNYARLLFACNSLPKSADKTAGFFRRWKVIPFPNNFQGQEDRSLLEKLSTPEVFSALLNRALTGLVRLEKNGGFSTPDTVEHATEDFRKQNDSVFSFISDQIIKAPDQSVPKEAVYAVYKNTWCPENGISHPELRKSFNDSFAFFLKISEGRKEIKGAKQRVWVGVKFREDVEVSLTGSKNERDGDQWATQALPEGFFEKMTRI